MFGELASQASRLAPDGVMDPAVGQLVAAGLASAATLLTASLMRSAYKCASGTAAHCQGVHDVSRGTERVSVPMQTSGRRAAWGTDSKLVKSLWGMKATAHLIYQTAVSRPVMSVCCRPQSPASATHTPPAQEL